MPMTFRDGRTGVTVSGRTVSAIAAIAMNLAKQRETDLLLLEQGVKKGERRTIKVSRLPTRDNRRTVTGHVYFAELLFPENGKSRRSRRIGQPLRVPSNGRG